MADNTSLGAAKSAKNDEFYTQYSDIEAEMNAYVAFNPDVFRDKTILLAEAQKKSKMEQQKENLNAYSISRQTRETIDAHRKNFRQELDVRGMRGDEALNAVTHFIDDAILTDMSQVRILHGKGDGILRQLVRQYLATVPNVKSFRDEHVQFGGAGITVAEIG